MQQSVNGNIKHKTCDNEEEEGVLAGNKTRSAVSTAIFKFSCTVGGGLGPTCCESAQVIPLTYDKEAGFSANSQQQTLCLSILQRREVPLTDFPPKLLSRSFTFMQMPAHQ